MHGSPAGFPTSPAAVSQSIVLGASRDSAKSQISGFRRLMALCRFLLADRPAPEARSTSSPGDRAGRQGLDFVISVGTPTPTAG
eukprot:COSAG01_NODE_4068_length_5383_cov_7.524981_2_plen_84_part_00